MARKPKITHPLNQTQLIEAVALELGVPVADATKAVHAVIDVVVRTVTSGHAVTVTNFGSWTPRRVPARKARNPQTGGTVSVPAHQVVRFRVAPRLAEIVRSRKAAQNVRKLAAGALQERP